MQLFEMQGLLAGKCLPGDMKVNEPLAEYLLRKLEDRNELERQLSAKTISEQSIINAFGIKGEGAHSKLVIEYVHGMVAENARMREAIEFATAPDMWQEQHDGMLDYRYVDWYVDVLNAALEPKSTDAAIAEIKGRGIDEWIESRTGRWNGTTKEAEEFAANLRAGRKG